MNPVRFKHFANIGDIVASLAAIKGYYERTGRKPIYCQQLDVPANYYAGATHPTLDEKEVMVMCNQKMFDMIKPLLLAQPYIEDVEVFKGQPINIDLDRIRKEVFVNIPHQAIQQWIFMAYPDLYSDLSKPWLEVKEVDVSECYFAHHSLPISYLPAEDMSNMGIVNFTERYRNPHIHYFFLQKFKNNLVFAGTGKEHQLFCAKWNLDIPRLIVQDFLQLAYFIKKAKFLLSNQSFCWNVAEALKTPRILELCEFAPNCQPFIGEKSYGFLHQSGAKYYVELLMSKN